MKNAHLYETHVKTKNLEEAITFYQKLELELAYVIPDRVAFFWLGDSKRKEQMLGVWKVSSDEFVKSHFAFQVTFEELVNTPKYLAEKGIEVVPSFGLDASEPVVHAWMPAASYYFVDNDGNSLEYITVLNDEPIPELGAIHLSTWTKAQENR
ncbi:VOC family protein [Anaerobacillus alkaliphilus]|uniref:VOC family protein n=1 Tax=Anaerobacillus alkaliphilus TaxID=1548597 RepID=A0A4Q0VQB7_9BACI|nr:VOC family protein [Anaerobacillus alkaliphilus]RXI98696.1 VOC family protein [Anaerobacillus alkaliphilus]